MVYSTPNAEEVGGFLNPWANDVGFVIPQGEQKMNNEKKQLDTEKISEILRHGNTAEIKETKDGITILEVSRKIRYRESADSKPSDHNDDEN
jgi:hypothetical protein